MKARILAVVLALTMLVCGPAAGVAVPLIESVRPIQMVKDGKLVNVCTASSISQERRHWITVAHCVPEEPIYIMGELAKWLHWDEAEDLAVLQTASESLPALKLAEVGVTFEAIVKTAGYPSGQLSPLLMVGTVSNPQANLNAGTDRRFMVYQLPGMEGDSGSPVVNAKGELVSVVQVKGPAPGLSPIMAGATFESLQALKAFFQ